MSTFLFILCVVLGSLSLCAAVVLFALEARRDDDMPWPGFLVIGLLLVGGYFGIRTIVRTVQTSDRNWCDKRAAYLDRETRYVYSGGSTYECIVKASDGRWIPIGQLRDVTLAEAVR